MTFGSLLRSVLGPSLLSGNSNKFVSDRAGAEYYHYGSLKKHKGKSKADKKHAILSALSLLAFLFFLNILQSCLREQNANRNTVMMFAPTGGTTSTGHQSKDNSKQEETRNVETRKSRTLLGFEEQHRQQKFIRNYSNVNNWTRELSQVSEKELEEQKVKTKSLPFYNRFASTELKARLDAVNKTAPLRRFKKRERTSTEVPKWDYKKADFHPSPYIPNRTHDNTGTTTPQLTINTPTTKMTATTPRNRRSDYSTVRPDYDDYDRYNEPADAQQPPPTVGLDLNTFQTFPVYNYYNHRTHNQTEEPTTPEIDRMHTEMIRVTTQPPLFLPTKTTKPYYRPRPKYPNHHGYYVRNHYPFESRYRYSPYRKTGTYEPAHFHDHPHDDYYPPVVVAKYEVQHGEPGFDLMKFFWAMLSSFAKPLTNLVPTFAKDNRNEEQCYDLLVCEAQRMSRFMGPTAEALATTFGTLLTWAATEETRQIVVDAINSGRENTCQQQIRDCEDRSGGKSAMTVIAQVMEMKLR